MNEFFNYLKCGNPAKLAEWVRSSESKFLSMGQDCKAKGADGAFCYEMAVSRCAQMAYWWHFGFRGKLAPQKIMEKGVELALAYSAVVCDRLARMGAGTDWKEGAAWFEPYSEAFLLATLAGCTRDRTQLADFLHSNLVVERTAIPIEPALGDVLLCIAASFQSRAMDTAPLVERVQKCRKQRPKLLYRAWRALQSGDREAFVSAVADSAGNFGKTMAEDNPLRAVALQESILVALAYERGWTDLSFELPIAARLVTRQSLELS